LLPAPSVRSLKINDCRQRNFNDLVALNLLMNVSALNSKSTISIDGLYILGGAFDPAPSAASGWAMRTGASRERIIALTAAILLIGSVQLFSSSGIVGSSKAHTHTDMWHPAYHALLYEDHGEGEDSEASMLESRSDGEPSVRQARVRIDTTWVATGCNPWSHSCLCLEEWGFEGACSSSELEGKPRVRMAVLDGALARHEGVYQCRHSVCEVSRGPSVEAEGLITTCNQLDTFAPTRTQAGVVVEGPPDDASSCISQARGQGMTVWAGAEPPASGAVDFLPTSVADAAPSFFELPPLPLRRKHRVAIVLQDTQELQEGLAALSEHVRVQHLGKGGAEGARLKGLNSATDCSSFRDAAGVLSERGQKLCELYHAAYVLLPQPYSEADLYDALMVSRVRPRQAFLPHINTIQIHSY
jgi:hypothetical protein